ncbi:hypothetical protein AWH48_15870 [Domibacillus aminovorans]|uniref:Uncharacterized protein n=1 Tax=Domibacillus aminovorans TaxID=29332 RepID=A0A177L378_9BACI|nr:hypothetical protein AWH48_15870 [Domibacillus aminovorans]
MAIASGFTLLVAGVLAAIAPADSMLVLIIALALLGLGWGIWGSAFWDSCSTIELRYALTCRRYSFTTAYPHRYLVPFKIVASIS